MPDANNILQLSKLNAILLNSTFQKLLWEWYINTKQLRLCFGRGAENMGKYLNVGNFGFEAVIKGQFIMPDTKV